MMQAGRGRLLWVTNLAAPYRLPVWEELSNHFRLLVGLLENSERMDRDRGVNRGADWVRQQGKGYRIVEYATAVAAHGENRHYTLTGPAAARDLFSSDAVLLGGWDSPAYWQLLVQARAAGCATVGFYESTLASQGRPTGPVAWARSLFFRSLDAVVVPGQAAGEAVEAMGVEPERIFRGFNAVDVKSFAAAATPHEGEGHRFLYVGQLIPRKNVEQIISSFAAIATPQDRLTLIGRGELRESLQAQVNDLGIERQVDFLPYIAYSELPAEMARHDTLVLASRVEVWGLVVNEALAAGLQSVVTDNCGVAPSVAGMPGVHTGPVEQLDSLMLEARDQFAGRIQDPPILRNTPEAFAAVFRAAVDFALSRPHGFMGRRTTRNRRQAS